MSENEAYLEQIESDEIKKIINMIYDSKPEDAIKGDMDTDKHAEIAKQLDSVETPKPGFWKKRKKIF